MRNFDLNLLLVLRTLLETTSVSETARRLDSTQPSVSRMLERLRVELGDPLLVKSSNTMVRTTRANELRPLLDKVIELLQAVYRAPGDYRLRDERRTCTIGASDSLQAMFAMPLIATMRALAPNARLRFKPVPYPNPMRSLLAGEIDLLLAMTDEENSGFRSDVLFKSSFSCMCAIENPHIGTRASIAAIAAMPYLEISHMGRISAATDAIFAVADKRKNTVAAMSSFLAAPGVIANSPMICLVPDYLARTLGLHPGVKVVPLQDDLKQHTIRMIWHNTTHFDAFLGAVRSLLQEIAKTPPYTVGSDGARTDAVQKSKKVKCDRPGCDS
ncbi:transcriptional regulator, LysR family [Verminephrobacter eiseniae EF01-2]|uniref:Transcriptional regulator, LysR family n=1 Tax=Verminephrobacter eiseniae (strain EF01-2) TaxID=391735 RepID=A1WF12_VEREI|nr:LysR family transcriptional regulator [Verminephrobacter eiseniae]ABM56219.1 transcriptional regulator, LysR family [Verminephrobacter eiseniae EF01-2]